MRLREHQRVPEGRGHGGARHPDRGEGPSAKPGPGDGVTEEPRPVFVVDFGAQYAQLIARRVRECHVYSEIVLYDVRPEDLAPRRPAAIILSGGPASVYEVGAPALNPVLLGLGVPVLGICYGQQAMAQALGGEVRATGSREY